MMFENDYSNIFMYTYLFDDNFVCHRFQLVKTFSTKARVLSASLHPDNGFLVAGGEDFALYKFNCENGGEIGKTIYYH